jgi:hypothetical protein
MEEVKISLETAILANKIGFNIETNNAYVKSNSGEVISMFYDGDIHKSFKFIAWIPTQSLFQKWLREKYNLHIAVYPIQYGWMIDVRDCDKIKSSHATFYDNQIIYHTYEEALEKGLEEAYNIILNNMILNNMLSFGEFQYYYDEISIFNESIQMRIYLMYCGDINFDIEKAILQVIGKYGKESNK